MNNVNYTGTKNEAGESGRYPLSTETLDFIQEQISLLESLAGIGGGNYILREPTDSVPGAVVIKESFRTAEGKQYTKPALYPLYGKREASTQYICVISQFVDVEADGVKYKNARKINRAEYRSVGAGVVYPLDRFLNLTGENFPTNESLATSLKNAPEVTMNYLREYLAQKLESRELTGVTIAQMNGMLTPGVYSCTRSVAVFHGVTDYTLVVTKQGASHYRQELIQEDNMRWVRTYSSGRWGTWNQQTETAAHLDVKIVGTTLYIRHGALPDDCSIVMVRKKRRGSMRHTGGPKSNAKHRGKPNFRLAKKQYVHFKGICFTKGTPGKWYVPKCESVANHAEFGNLVGKEFMTLCESFFYKGPADFDRVQGSRKRMVLKGTTSKVKKPAHTAYVSVGIQIARLRPTGGKDGGGEIVHLRWRLFQTKYKVGSNYRWKWDTALSME